MAGGDKARVWWPRRVGPVVPSDQSRYIGSGEAASYRRLPPPEPQKALSWHVPLPVLMGPLGTASPRTRFLFSGRFRRDVQRGSGQDVRLGALDRVESEHANRLDQDRRAGDDRWGAVGVEARYPLALLERDRGEFAEHAVAGFEQQAVTVDLVGVVRIELLIDRGQGRRRAGDGDPFLHCGADLGRDRVVEDRADGGLQRDEVLLARRVLVEMALGLADRAGLRRDAERRVVAGAADDVLGAATADVDDEQRALAFGPCRSCAEERQARLFLAGNDARVEAVAIVQQLAE